MSRIGLVLLVLALSGCPEECVTGETRCLEGEAQICGSDGSWRTFMDCGDLGGPGWICCWLGEDPVVGVPAGHGCVEAVTCPVPEEE